MPCPKESLDLYNAQVLSFILTIFVYYPCYLLLLLTLKASPTNVFWNLITKTQSCGLIFFKSRFRFYSQPLKKINTKRLIFSSIFFLSNAPNIFYSIPNCDNQNNLISPPHFPRPPPGKWLWTPIVTQFFHE